MKRRSFASLFVVVVAISLILSGCFGGGSGGDSTPYAASGRITDVQGNGVSGITVSFSGGTSSSTTTDAEGKWQASLKGTVRVEPQGYRFDPPYKNVTSKSSKADFVLLEDEYIVLHEKEVVVEDKDIVLSSEYHPDAPEVEFKKGTLPQKTEIRYEVVEDIPTFEEVGFLSISGSPVRLKLTGDGSYQSLSDSSNKFTIRGQYTEGDKIECIGIFNGEVWVAYLPELHNGYWQVEVDFASIDVRIDGSLPIEIARFDDVFENSFETQGVFDPKMDLFKWSRTADGWEKTDLAPVKGEIRTSGGANTFFLVHGLNSSNDDMSSIAKHLSTHNNLLIYAIDYGWIRGIETQGAAFADILKECVPTNQRINIIAHSMGGLVTRSAIELADAKKHVQTVLTLGTPHLGVPRYVLTSLELNILDWRTTPFNFIDDGATLLSAQIRDLREGTMFFDKIDNKKPNTIYYAFVIGDSNLGHRYTRYTKHSYGNVLNDGLVSVVSAGRGTGDPAKRPDYRQTFPLNHTELRLDSMVMAEIDELFGLFEDEDDDNADDGIFPTPTGYNHNDYQKLVTFLEQKDESGVKNGEKISTYYHPSDPETWRGADWTNEKNKRVYSIRWPRNLNLVGALVLTDCTSLEILDCQYNQLTTLDVSSLSSLEILHCRGNQLTTLDVSGLSSLEYLYCDDNQLTTLDVSGLSSLEYLDCNANQLTTLDVSGLSSLETLYCSGNQLTTLDVSGLSSLEYLYCNSNQLTALDVSGCSSLEVLYCEFNQLTTLDVSGLSSFKKLFSQQNPLTTLNVSGCSSLRTLHCNANQLTTLDVSGLSSLEYLNCTSSQLTALDVSGLSSLRTLYCESNQLTTLDVSDCSSLWTLHCESNQLTTLDMSDCSFLQYLHCESNQLTTLNVSGLSYLVHLTCHNNQLTTLDVSGCFYLEKRLLSHDPQTIVTGWER